MPHRVSTFIKTTTTSFEAQVSNLKQVTTRRRYSTSRAARRSGSSDRNSHASVLNDAGSDDWAPNMVSQRGSRKSSFSSDAGAKEHHRRLSFHGLHLGRKDKNDHPPAQPPLGELTWRLESPPAVCYGDERNSSGALVSGQLCMDVMRSEGLDIETLKATMSIQVTQKKPFAPNCDDCAHQLVQLKSWNFLERPMFMPHGPQEFPFSILLEGHLPASVDTTLVSISYRFKAEAIPKLNGAILAPISLERTLDVKRSLSVPEMPHHSVRVFPPTNIKASTHYPQVIHPIGSNTLQLRLDGISNCIPQHGTVEYWRLKKLTWRIEETVKVIAPACAKHAPSSADDGRKGIQRSDTRTISSATMVNGWKSNYLSADSYVELELDYQASAALTSQSQPALRPNCDVHANDGTEVTHQLMLELVVSEEWAPIIRPGYITQTGNGRVLRMHFGTVMTERSGIGISWDNEAPPIYQDVPPSPPVYNSEQRHAHEGTYGGAPPAIDHTFEMLDGHSVGSPTARPCDDMPMPIIGVSTNN